MRHAMINLAWIGYHPGSRLDPGFWVEVVEQLVIWDHDPETATEIEVRAAITHVETHEAAKISRTS